VTRPASRCALITASLAAWLYTGPLGHLAAGIADWAELLARHLWARRRG